jgi:hypothetical protein
MTQGVRFAKIFIHTSVSIHLTTSGSTSPSLASLTSSPAFAFFLKRNHCEPQTRRSLPCFFRIFRTRLSDWSNTLKRLPS